MWFEFSPAPRPDDGDDRDAYRRRAANAAARLGLASRPSIDTLAQAFRRIFTSEKLILKLALKCLDC